jgi:hypothetical protein
MSYHSRGTDLAKSVKSFAGRRPWPGDHLHRIREVATRPPIGYAVSVLAENGRQHLRLMKKARSSYCRAWQ